MEALTAILMVVVGVLKATAGPLIAGVVSSLGLAWIKANSAKEIKKAEDAKSLNESVISYTLRQKVDNDVNSLSATPPTTKPQSTTSVTRTQQSGSQPNAAGSSNGGTGISGSALDVQLRTEWSR